MKKIRRNINKFIRDTLIDAVCRLFLGSIVLGTMVITMAVNVKAYDDVVIVIDPGHGGEVTEEEGNSNGGAMYNDLMEKDINLITAKAMRDELAEYCNVTVYLTREDDIELSLTDRVQFAKSVNADYLVSVHYNASADNNLFGSEIFTSAFGEYYAEGRGMAECIVKRWKDYGNTIKDIKTRIGESGDDYYGLIREAVQEDIPAIILEHGYIDNDRDFLRMNNEDAWEELGKEDAIGVADYLGLEKDVVKELIEPTVKVGVPDEKVMPDETAPVGIKLSVDDYDVEAGDIRFTINAYDDESKLMYYGFVKDKADSDTVFHELELWNGANGKLQGVYHVGAEYDGKLTAAVFNSYNLYDVSNTVTINPDEYAHSSDEAEVLADNTGENSEAVEETSNDTDKTPDGAPETEETEEKTEEVKAEDEAESDFEKLSKNVAELNEAMSDAVEKGKTSTVQDSFNKFSVVILVAALILVLVLIVILANLIGRLSNGSRNNKKNEERNSDSWADYYDKM